MIKINFDSATPLSCLLTFHPLNQCCHFRRKKNQYFKLPSRHVINIAKTQFDISCGNFRRRCRPRWQFWPRFPRLFSDFPPPRTMVHCPARHAKQFVRLCNIHQYFWTRFTVTPNNENIVGVLKCYSIRVQVVFNSFHIKKPTIQAYTGLETDQLVLQVYKKNLNATKMTMMIQASAVQSKPPV